MPTLPDPDEHDLDVLRGRIPVPADDPDAALLARLGRVARSRDDDGAIELTPPPAALWDRIAAATSDDAAPTDDAGAPDAGVPDAGVPDAGAPDLAPPTPIRRARPSGWWLAAAAAVVVVLGVGAVVSWPGRDDDSLVASAELEPLVPEAGAPAEARLVETGDGLRLEVAVTDADLPPADGFHEVWLLDPEAAGMVSLGPLRADERYVLPPNVDFHDFPVVDISAEPPDGDPTHSGASLLRGTLS